MAARQLYTVSWTRDGNVYPILYKSGMKKGQVRTWNNRHTALADSERYEYEVPANCAIHIHPVIS